MPRDNGIHQPWDSIKHLLSPRPAGGSVKSKHPRRTVLRAYIKGALPDRPTSWTRERAESLANGKLRDWTYLEVAAHIADCARCRARLDALKQTLLSGHVSVLERLRHVVTQPRWGTVGWALAGAQAAVLVGLVVWSGFFANPETQTGDPISFPLLNGVSEYHAISHSTALWVQFAPQAPWSEVTSWLQSLELEVLGPDEAGRYLIVGDDITRDLLESGPWVVRVESPVEKGDEP